MTEATREMDAAEFVPRAMSFDEFLAFDEASDERHEYVDGVVYAMSGATLSHNTICGNIFARLYAAAGDGPCRAYVEGARLRATNDIYRPDVMVVCDDADRDDRMAHSPCLIVEVSSPSTERTDRREKRDAYRRIPTLQAYLQVRQHERRIVRHWRDEAGGWHYADFVGGERVPLPCPTHGWLDVDDAYRGLDVPAPTVRRVRESAPADAEVEDDRPGDG